MDFRSDIYKKFLNAVERPQKALKKHSWRILAIFLTAIAYIFSNFKVPLQQ